MMRRRLLLAAPLAAAGLGGGAFWMILRRMRQGTYDPYAIDNPLLDHPVPASTPPLPPGPLLVNFFAAWCLPCREEMPALMALKNQGVTICGVVYKDTSPKVDAMLSALGNPYATMIWDDSGRLAIDWGASGVPETYLVDRSGIVRRRWVGALPVDAVRAAMRAA